MNSPHVPGESPRGQNPRSEAAKASLLRTHNLFRMFIVTVLGSFFVFQLDVNYLWLAGILTVASLVLGVLLLVRATKLRESRLVLFGTISGLVVALVMALMVTVSAVFFNQIRDYQQCARHALTQQAASACRTELEKSMPTQLR
ncbi:hypothetical protein E7Y32_01375 [Arthrobacter sp. UKPF54-2]|uniref:hypothetical protein n=1 Tax=Arthrobacter sp. UKPF54-2 TaxID=2600159 RepID=UPI0011B19D71|nr:hypothetical protein [Arthrobacter sp. UKPF54-2]QDY89020.1 hypothetical protein E7Y32_01375 [Arthrobacter sp. UKPF54-2]